MRLVLALMIAGAATGQIPGETTEVATHTVGNCCWLLHKKPNLDTLDCIRNGKLMRKGSNGQANQFSYDIAITATGAIITPPKGITWPDASVVSCSWV